MSPWLLALAVGIVVALIQYGARDLRSGGPSLVAALLRVAAVTLLVALLLDAPAARARAVSTWAALDASLSMTRGDSSVWRAAGDSVRRAGAESVFVFGDSVRRGNANAAPGDLSTQLRPAVERALGAGHPLVVVTDGEIDDPDAARGLPAGSRIVVLPHPVRRDLAVATIDVPRAIVSGDTVEARVGVVAGSGGARAGTLTLALEGRTIATSPVDSLPSFGERTIVVKSKLEGSSGPSILRAVVASAGDAEPRNDTASVAVDLSRAATAVFVSTSPDFDARYALAVLRGSLGIPTRGFFRVAPGEWRIEGALTPIAEAEVRQAVREAPVAIIHGDTSAFGPPRSTTLGPLALIVTSSTEGEWYPSAAPSSPLAPALSGLAWDSLPPVGIAANPPTGSWQGVEARRGRGDERKPIVVGTDEPRRVVVVAASGLWRWRFRGGVASDAFTALWGSIFDWLAAERADHRAAVPDDRMLRAGDPVRWRRGAPTDTIVSVALHQRGATRVDSLTLRFGGSANVVETKPLPAGIYEVTTRGGTALLAMNPSREWLPRPPRVPAGAVRGTISADLGPRLRNAGWAYALAILLLCAEWILRRRRGMR
jgi:xanthine/CO dehydrogenase XdhC/CoxF family maturation factor